MPECSRIFSKESKSTSILLTSKANKEILTWAVFNVHDLIIITPVKRPTQCACFTCLISGGGGLNIGPNLNFGMVIGLKREGA